MIYLWATLFFVANLAAWLSTLFLLPGNWIILLLAAIYAWLLPEPMTPHLSWTAVAVAFVLATIGEVIEFAGGAAGSAKHGGSRRGMALAIVGTFVGSLLGAAAGVPIPVVGPMIGALLFGTVGAFVGAYLGETWVGREHVDRMKIGQAAMIGRVIGTTGKLVCGLMMVMIVAIDSYFDFS